MIRKSILLAVAALPLAAADMSGTWSLEGEIAGVNIKRVCEMKQVENKLTGACKNQANELALKGQVNGHAVTWTYDADYQGQKVTLNFTGKWESENAITGGIEADGASGHFTAKRQPA